MGSEWPEVQHMLAIITHLVKFHYKDTTDSTTTTTVTTSASAGSSSEGLSAWELATIVNSLQCMGGNSVGEQ
jgi:hypothetical protein